MQNFAEKSFQLAIDAMAALDGNSLLGNIMMSCPFQVQIYEGHIHLWALIMMTSATPLHVASSC